MTAQRVAGAFLALLGAVGVTASAYLSWFSDRTPESAPIDRLFESGVTEQASSYWTSVALPLAVVTFVAAIGVLLRSRVVLAVGWLIGLATLVLFVVQELNDAADFAIGDLQAGAWVAIAGLIIMLVGVVSMGGRPAPEFEVPEPVSVGNRRAAGGSTADTPIMGAAPAGPATGSVPVAPPPAPEPLATDSPTPEPTPSPSPDPMPSPGPTPTPEPGPTPAPAPGPPPAPEPEPEPGPGPEPEPGPGPGPQPEPGTPPPPMESEDEPPRG